MKTNSNYHNPSAYLETIHSPNYPVILMGNNILFEKKLHFLLLLPIEVTNPYYNHTGNYCHSNPLNNNDIKKTGNQQNIL